MYPGRWTVSSSMSKATTPLGLAKERIRNSGLSGRSFSSPHEVVAWHGAMQAQDYALAKWSIGQRSSGVADEDVDRALGEGTIIRTHVLRPTWHFVAAGDIRWMLALTASRVRKHLRSRWRELGLDPPTLARAESLIAGALEQDGRLTRDGVGRVLAGGGVDPSGQRLPHILLHCELESVICSGGIAGKQHTYALLDDRLPVGRRFERDDALRELVRRYLQSHGPATVKDLAWWSSLTIKDLRTALDILGSELRTQVIEGITFIALAAKSERPARGHGTHLLQAYDELLVGYTESRFFGDPRQAAARAAWRDRNLPTGVLLIDGAVAGHWRRTLKKDLVTLEVFLYDRSTPPVIRRVETAATDMGRFLGRRARVDLRPSSRRR